MASSRQIQSNDRPKHIICFVALPFKDNDTFKYETVLLPALREALELKPYHWQVVRADERYFEDIIQNNIRVWMDRVQVYIADVSDENPNVMMELGYMLWTRETGQPLVVLKRSDTNPTISDLAGFIYTVYPAVSSGDMYDIQKVTDALKKDFARRDDMQNLNKKKEAHYLSALYLEKKFGSGQKLSEYFNTMESVEAASPDEFREKAIAAGIPPGFVGAVRKTIIEELKELRKYSQ
jgi:molecular chaperone HtpG